MKYKKVWPSLQHKIIFLRLSMIRFEMILNIRSNTMNIVSKYDWILAV